MANKKAGPGSDDTFVYPIHGHTITVPSLSKVPARTMQRATKAEGLDQAFVIIDAVVPEDDSETNAALDLLTVDELGDFIEAWGAHSGVSVGESPAS